MISKVAKKKIKRELKKTGKGYVEVILNYLEQNDIKNSKGDFYSASMIRHVMNLPITHLRLEVAIYDCFNDILKANREEEKWRKKLLSKAK